MKNLLPSEIQNLKIYEVLHLNVSINNYYFLIYIKDIMLLNQVHRSNNQRFQPSKMYSNLLDTIFHLYNKLNLTIVPKMYLSLRHRNIGNHRRTLNIIHK